MAQQEKTLTVQAMDRDAILATCYSAFKQLQWNVLYAGEATLLAVTKKKWNTSSQQIIITAGDQTLTVTSKMTSGELMDALGKNNKNIATFLAVFDDAQASIVPAAIAENKQAILALQAETVQAAAEEETAAAAVDQAMNLSGGNLYATYTIIALNCLVFILMALDGAGIMEPNGLVHLKWGSDFAPLTLSGDWWRLLTNVFIHFGIIHLAFNMYSLYIAGTYLERMLGKPRYLAAYFCTGVLASITSLWWHTTPQNSAGASGAIFGLYGLFLAFLTTSLIPVKVRNALLQSIGIFVVYNLAYGMKDGVDNAAHLGGLLSGFVIGYVYIAGIKKEKKEYPSKWIAPAVALFTTGIAFYYLQHHKAAAGSRAAVMNEIKNAGYKDNKKFAAAYDQFLAIQDTAMAPWKDSTLTNKVLAEKLTAMSLPAWDRAAALVKNMQALEVSEQAHKKNREIALYIELRKEEISIFNSLVSNTADLSKLNEVRERINKVVTALQ